MMFVLGGITVTLYLAWIVWVVVTVGRRYEARQSAWEEQRRIRHQQFVAERRLQCLTGQALQAMLDAGRQSEPIGRETYQSGGQQ